MAEELKTILDEVDKIKDVGAETKGPNVNFQEWKAMVKEFVEAWIGYRSLSTIREKSMRMKWLVLWTRWLRVANKKASFPKPM